MNLDKNQSVKATSDSIAWRSRNVPEHGFNHQKAASKLLVSYKLVRITHYSHKYWYYNDGSHSASVSCIMSKIFMQDFLLVMCFHSTLPPLYLFRCPVSGHRYQICCTLPVILIVFVYRTVLCPVVLRNEPRHHKIKPQHNTMCSETCMYHELLKLLSLEIVLVELPLTWIMNFYVEQKKHWTGCRDELNLCIFQWLQQILTDKVDVYASK